jgi:hypothetical protein
MEILRRHLTQQLQLVLKIVDNQETNSGTNSNYDRTTHTVTLGQ